jgi:signal transduction histidine kinase
VRRWASRPSASFYRLPIRLRLAGVSALLTFVILCVFAVAIGSLTVHRIRENFNREVQETAERLRSQLNIEVVVNGDRERLVVTPGLTYFTAGTEHASIRVFGVDGSVLAEQPAHTPWFGPPDATPQTLHDYRVISRAAPVRVAGVARGHVFVQYARSISETEATVRRVELFLLLGVFGGTALALLAGMAIARRAMAPIAQLTSTAAEIARTRDPSREVPEPHADDEVAELARTLQGMLHELDAARGETEAALARQRQFVADASHELRTPLTSVLANLELLAESLDGDEGEAASSALRSSRRMRRLVADLLLLARSDAAQPTVRERCDLAQIVVEAAGELGAVSDGHEIVIDAQPAPVHAARDELHRVAINLIENALRYTPAGTAIRVSTSTTPQGIVELVVEDDGPGIPPELADTLFERFVRGAGDRGGSFGLGLAIVQAIAASHGGSVALEPSPRDTGARFVVRLPACSDLDDDGQDHRPALQTLVNQGR